MKIIEAQDTYVLQFDAVGNVTNGSYLSAGTTVISNDESTAVTGFTTPQVDWAINDAAEKGISGDLLILESEPRSIASDEAVIKLVAEGKTVITSDV